MIDLTSAFKDALARQQEWGYEAARGLAKQLIEFDGATRVKGGFNGNWLWVRDESRLVALVYQIAPLVIADDDLVVNAKEALSSVTVVTGLADYDEAAFRMDERQADRLLPYPIDEVKLEWDGFSASDFVYETV